MIKPFALTLALCSFGNLTALADEKAPQSVHEITVRDIDGKEVALSKYKGKALLIVNVASQCGVTDQYTNLQNLHRQFEDKGLVVMAFPANDFGGQEPGTNAEIKKFCTANYGVEFPIFAKSSAAGDDQAPIFQYLTTAKNPDRDGRIGWNFEKFLISHDGKVVARYRSKVKPDDPQVVKAIDAELAKAKKKKDKE